MLIKFPILITEDLLEIAIYLVFLKGCWTKELHSNYCSCQCIVFMTWRKKVWKNFLHFCLQAIQAINGQTNMTAEEFTNMIFQKIDVNNDGKNLGFLGIASVYPAMSAGSERELSIQPKNWKSECIFSQIYSEM